MAPLALSKRPHTQHEFYHHRGIIIRIERRQNKKEAAGKKRRKQKKKTKEEKTDSGSGVSEDRLLRVRRARERFASKRSGQEESSLDLYK
jgi:hypothetical protein